MHRMCRRTLCLALAYLMCSGSFAATRTVTLQQGTRIYIETDQELIGKKDRVQEGQIVPYHVWRDVVVEGQTVVKAGTPVLVRVDKVKTAKVAGIKGSISLGAYETKGVDGQAIQLNGGYMKEGESRIVSTALLAGLVLWPLIFIKGKAAELPRGTIFDAFVGIERQVRVEGEEAQVPVLDLSQVVSDLTVEVLYDRFEKAEKPQNFEFRITAPAAVSSGFSIDRINGESTDPIPLTETSRRTDEDRQLVEASVPIKALAKRFRKGINRFHVACEGPGGRLEQEVILNLQF